MENLGSHENRDEWQNWPTAGRESNHRALIKAWGEKKESWSGNGKHVKDVDIRHPMPRTGDELGHGMASLVEKITFRSIPLARKTIRGHRYWPLKELRKEVEIMERLSHRHIVLLVGSYASTSKQNRLYLLLYPAATCDLNTFLHDIDDIRHGAPTNLAESSKRFELLGFKGILPNSWTHTQQMDASSISWHEPLKYLRSILGCITEAIAFVHSSKVRHLDLKPQNILLTPRRAFLADFGTSRNLEDASNSLTEGWAGATEKYLSPEAYEKRLHPMSSADIYSMGAIFLALATVLYGESLKEFDSIMRESKLNLKMIRITGFLDRLRNSACKEDVRKGGQPDRDQHHIVDLVEAMLDYEPENRPTALQVANSLVELGGRKQIYFEECCQKNDMQLANLRASIIKDLEDKKKIQTKEIRDLAAKLEILKKRDENFDLTLEKEKMTVATIWSRTLESERKALEASKKELEIARGKIRKLEEENQKLKSRKDKRNHTIGKSGTLTPSRLPVPRNSSSPSLPPKPSDQSTRKTIANSETDLNASLRTPSQPGVNDDSDSYSAMAASGMTLFDSFSSISPHSSSPPSPSTSKSIKIEIPKIKEAENEIAKIKAPNVSKSYADMLRPTTKSMKLKNGAEKSNLKHVAPLSLRGPVAWRSKATET